MKAGDGGIWVAMTDVEEERIRRQKKMEDMEMVECGTEKRKQ